MNTEQTEHTAESSSAAEPVVPPETEDRGRQATTPTELTPRGWKDILFRVKDEIGNDHQVLASAGVAFFAFLAVIPGLAALLSIAGLVVEAETVAQEIDDLLQGLPSEARDLLASQLETLASQSNSSLQIGLLISVGLALWSASGGMGHLIAAVNVAYDEDDNRNFLVKRLLAIALTLAAIAFVLIAVVGLVGWPAIVAALGLPSVLEQILNWLLWPVLALAFIVGLGVLYRVAPDRDAPRWRWVSWGAVIAAVVWLVASAGFRYYVNTFGSYNESYGSLAAVVVLMLWLFISAFVVLLGAQINSEMEHQTTRDTTVGPAEPMGQRGAVVADTVGENSA